MVKRHVVQPLMSYRDPDGQLRHALSGTDIDVHPDDLEAFDKVNDPDKVSTPTKAKGPATTEPSPTSRRSVKKASAKAAGRAPTPRK
jgi:hypothetical protein